MSKTHLNSLCKKASQELHALVRIPTYMDTNKFLLITITLIISQSSYCPLIWIFGDRSINNQVKKIHERHLGIAYTDSHSGLKCLLERNNSMPLQQKNQQLPLIASLTLIHMGFFRNTILWSGFATPPSEKCLRPINNLIQIRIPKNQIICKIDGFRSNFDRFRSSHQNFI